MNNITIVGGGTAGVIAALKMQRDYGDISSVTIIRSEEIGVLGAGEGSTANFISILRELGITVEDLVRNTYSTIKLGINFQGWTSKQSSYFHSFNDHNISCVDVIENILHNNLSLDDIDVYAAMAKECKVMSVDALDKGLNYAIHFDATELAKYLEQVALSRGVNIINDKVVGVETDSDDYIISLLLEEQEQHQTDFVFDCTGFRRLLVGEHYGSEWVSLSEYLPMNKAQPFFLPPSKNPHPWTDAISQDAGWIWRIPLQHRYGCGYVYNDNYISNAEVRESILNQYPNADIPDRTFNFEAGYYKEQFVKNCIAVGLASSFVEPLEATSIFAFIMQLNNIHPDVIPMTFQRKQHNLEVYLDTVREDFNRRSEVINLEIAHFIQLHYITRREDTAFWKDYKNNKRFKLVESTLEILNTGCAFSVLHPSEASVRPFGTFNYLAVGHGNELINGSAIVPSTAVDLDAIVDNIKAEVASLPTHGEFIDHLKNNNTSVSWN